MVVLICFDLPRTSKKERSEATKFSKQLIELGFVMRQFSIYERYIANSHSITNILEALNNSIPETGAIVLYPMSDEAYSQQKIILGSNTVLKPSSIPKIIYV